MYVCPGEEDRAHGRGDENSIQHCIHTLYMDKKTVKGNSWGLSSTRSEASRATVADQLKLISSTAVVVS